MAILFHPKPGMLLICDFNTGFKPPEMVKKRPVVIVSHARGQVATVVPLSTAEPIPIESHHYEMTPGSLPTSLRAKRCWAKCDMLSCVALWRLDRIMVGKHPRTGKRIYVSPQILTIDFEGIRRVLRSTLQL